MALLIRAVPPNLGPDSIRKIYQQKKKIYCRPVESAALLGIDEASVMDQLIISGHYRTRVLCRVSQAEKHSATSLPSVALGEAHTAFLLSAKPALPSAFSRALDKPLPCAKPHSAKKS